MILFFLFSPSSTEVQKKVLGSSPGGGNYPFLFFFVSFFFFFFSFFCWVRFVTHAWGKGGWLFYRYDRDASSNFFFLFSINTYLPSRIITPPISSSLKAEKEKNRFMFPLIYGRSITNGVTYLSTYLST